MDKQEFISIKNLIQSHLGKKDIEEAAYLAQKLLSEFPDDKELPEILSNRLIMPKLNPDSLYQGTPYLIN